MKTSDANHCSSAAFHVSRSVSDPGEGLAASFDFVEGQAERLDLTLDCSDQAWAVEEPMSRVSGGNPLRLESPWNSPGPRPPGDYSHPLSPSRTAQTYPALTPYILLLIVDCDDQGN